MSTIQIKGAVLVTPQIKTSQSGKSYCTLVIDSSFTSNEGKTFENYLEIKFFGDNAAEVCKTVTEGQRLTVNCRLQGEYKEAKLSGKTYYNLTLFGKEIIKEEAKEEKPKTDKTKKAVSPSPSDDDDLPF